MSEDAVMDAAANSATSSQHVGSVQAAGGKASLTKGLDVTAPAKKSSKEKTRDLTTAEAPLTAPQKFNGPYATVSFGLGKQINMGKYEHYKVFVNLTMPCAPDKVEETFKKIDDWVSEKLVTEVKAAEEARDGQKAYDKE